MRIRMPVLAASIIAGALALGSGSAAANPEVALDAFSADSPMTVMVVASPEAAGEMCFISQAGQMIGGGPLNFGPNSFLVAADPSMGDLTADGPGLVAMATGLFDDVWQEE